MSETRLGTYEEFSRLRERVAVLERNLSYMAEQIATLQRNQNDNRAYSEKAFGEVKEELQNIKLAIASAPKSTNNVQIQRYLLAIGVFMAIVAVLLLVNLVRGGIL